jgi:hypothetical protein
MVTPVVMPLIVPGIGSIPVAVVPSIPGIRIVIPWIVGEHIPLVPVPVIIAVPPGIVKGIVVAGIETEIVSPLVVVPITITPTVMMVGSVKVIGQVVRIIQPGLIAV